MIYLNTLNFVEFGKYADKYIFCFGAGRAFDNFFEEFSQFDFWKKVKAIVDNRVKGNSNQFKIIYNADIPIISLEEMLKKIDKDDIIMITTAAYKEIIDQLNAIEKLNYNRFCIYNILRIGLYDYARMQINIPVKLSTYKNTRIPKVIHYCWFGRKEIPAQCREWMGSWKKHCPDYEMIEWNEDNYDVHKNQYISQAYDLKQWAFVSDYARVDVINKYGGVYLDTDVELIKNIDELMMNDAFCGFESKQYVAFGLSFGAVKCNDLIGEIKEYYDRQVFIQDDGTLNKTTCPVIQTEIMKKHGLKCNGEYQIVDGMKVYPSRVLCGMSPYSFRVERNPVHTYAIHHFMASWHESDKWKKQIQDMKEWIGNDDNYIYPDL